MNRRRSRSRHAYTTSTTESMTQRYERVLRPSARAGIARVAAASTTPRSGS